MLSANIGRAEHDAARDAIEFDERQGRIEGPSRRQQHRAAAQPPELSTQA
jgi:hypothetical protein